MNWIASAFEALKARFEAHVKHANTSLTDLSQRIDGAETYVRSAIGSAESRLETLEKSTVQSLDNRVKALELKFSAP